MVDRSVERRANQQVYVLMAAIQNPEAFREKLDAFAKSRGDALAAKGAAVAASTELNEGRRAFEEERAGFEKSAGTERDNLARREKGWWRVRRESRAAKNQPQRPRPMPR